MLSTGLILRERYKIIKHIGSGGSSKVYLAEDVAIGKKWAIKFLSHDADENKWLAQNEINMMIMLDNEMFPRIVDAWQEHDGYFIVSDYVEGITLEKYVRKNTVPKKTMLEWWIRIANGLLYLHSCRPSILYLDLKLENIMIKSDGSLKLIDFGVAGRIADKGSLYGTKGYAAPEQYYNRGDMLDERTDVFAFGMLMYSIATGCHPSIELEEQTARIKKSRKIPTKVKNIILQCIEKDKELRYKDMAELIEDLEELRGRKKGIHQIKLLTASMVAAIAISGLAAVNMVVAEPVKNVAEKMIEEANEHISNGQYTDEGIRIICGYIDSGCLDQATAQKFTYIVAKYNFESKRNYGEALRYFKNIEDEQYTDVQYYIRLCEFQLSFEEDAEAYISCLNDFAKYNKGLGYSSNRYENELMLATQYEALGNVLDDEENNWLLECLSKGLDELTYAKLSGLFEDENDKYEAEYCRRLCILYEELGDKENTCKYGERALALMDDGESGVQEDIKNRINVVKDY